jgi:hypothetical protein
MARVEPFRPEQLPQLRALVNGHLGGRRDRLAAGLARPPAGRRRAAGRGRCAAGGVGGRRRRRFYRRLGWEVLARPKRAWGDEGGG